MPPRKLTAYIQSLSLTRMLRLSYLLLLAAALVISGGFMAVNLSSLSVGQTNRYTLASLNEVNEQIAEKIGFIAEISLYISRNHQVVSALKYYGEADAIGQLEIEWKLRRLLGDLWMYRPEIYNIVVFAAGKKYVSESNNGVYPLEEALQEDWVKSLGDQNAKLIETRKYGLNTAYQEDNVLSSLVRVTDGAGKTIGMVSVDMAEEHLYQMLQPLQQSENSRLFVLNREGALVSCGDKSLLGQPSGCWPLLQGFLREPDAPGGCRRVRLEGRSCLLVYSDQSDLGWRTVQLIPMAEIYKGADRAVGSACILVALCLLLVYPLSVYMSRLVAAPIRSLSAQMKALRFTDQKPPKATTWLQNEIGELYESFNSMARRNRELMQHIWEEQQARHRSEIRALQAQINPHFLYNTLDSINWMALDYGAQDISRMVTMLSRLLRISLSKEDFTYTLGDELSHVEYYMQIQKVRYKDKFTYEIVSDPSLESCLVPRLIIQPLVENSILHGFTGMEKGGHITIGISCSGGEMTIDVCDNGQSPPAAQLQELLSVRRRNGGYGLQNIHERIRYLFGAQYGLRFLPAARGAHVQVRFPTKRCPAGACPHR